jgi:hypothetical protein
MPLEQVCLEIKRGDSWSRTIYFEDASNARINITGWEIRFTVKAKIDDLDSAAVISKIITVFSDPTNGEAEVSLTSLDTNQTIGSYLFDLQVKTNLSEVYTVLEGIMNISQDVTRLS